MKSPKDRFPDADNIKGSSSTPSEDPTPPKTRKERRKKHRELSCEMFSNLKFWFYESFRKF